MSEGEKVDLAEEVARAMFRRAMERSFDHDERPAFEALRESYISHANAALSRLSELGYAVVRVEPSDDMVAAAKDASLEWLRNDQVSPVQAAIYRAMISSGKV